MGLSGWRYRGLAEWTEGDIAYLSIVFSWLLPNAFQKAVWWKSQGYDVRAGGPAVSYNPRFLSGVARVGGGVDALLRHNPNATFTSRGCIRKCKFCIVPKVEGELKELDDWVPRPIVCDNNILATSKKHFDRVIDSLKPLEGVDFNQGLDARLLTKYHAEQLAELNVYCVRLAFDHVAYEQQFLTAFERLLQAGFPPSKVRAYVLIGYKDTPEDALYRLRKVMELGALPNPMRYQPIDTPRKNSHVAPNWTDAELKRMMRYWSRLRFTSPIPYEDFGFTGHDPRIPLLDEHQLPLI